MRTLLAVALITVLAFPAVASAQAGLTASGITGGGGFDTSPGCPFGRRGLHAKTVYDSASHERVEFRNECLTRTITAVNVDNGAKWRVDVYPGGDLTGVDADGASWRYQQHAKLFKNLKTGQICTRSDPRHVCQARPS
jgi:hypothetical protein